MPSLSAARNVMLQSIEKLSCSSCHVQSSSSQRLQSRRRQFWIQSAPLRRAITVSAEIIAQRERTMGTSEAKVKAPSLSKRIVETDTPIMVQMTRLLGGAKDVLSLGQGIVYWSPPEKALQAAEKAVLDPRSHGYGIDDGTTELRAALVEKVRRENHLMDSAIMVTAGANQAFFNVVVVVCDPEDTAVLFRPYYFNHQMAFQMTGVNKILYGRCDPETLHPDPDWVEEALSGKHGPVPRVITICNPCNPTGTYVPAPLLNRISKMCKKAGTWLILDNTYEYFMFDGREHLCLEGEHIINVFSFSKAYGMMGWRVGYIAYPQSVPDLGASLLKAQDTIPICANLVAQRAALAALEEGPGWVRERVKTLSANREVALEALACLGEGAVKGGEGGIYLWAKLPEHCKDDRAVVKWLVEKHGVAVIPGSSSGGDGCIRVAFGNLNEETYRIAAGRLKKGLEELISRGMVS